MELPVCYGFVFRLFWVFFWGGGLVVFFVFCFFLLLPPHMFLTDN